MSAQITQRQPTHATDVAVALIDVSHEYLLRDATVLATLENLSMEVDHGQVLAVVGPSGCGKTTILELICGLQRPRRGTVVGAPAALMPQHDLLFPWMDAVDNAALALRLGGRSRRYARAAAGEMFDELGLEGFQESHPQELSGGMRQRVAFLRTLLSGKPVLCLDEPFGALDAITRQEMQGWLARTLSHQPRTVVLVTHDVEEAVILADRVLVLCNRPAHTVRELDVTAPRPRRATDPEVVGLRARALDALGVAVGDDGR